MPAELLAALARMDVALFQWLRTYHTPVLDVFMAALSEVARGGLLWIVLAIILGCFKSDRWPAVLRTLLAVGLSILITDQIVKPYVNRSRPYETYTDTRVFGPRPTSRSLPSGHAANAVAAAFALARVASSATALFWTLAFLVSFSRVYLGVHYLADVLIGGLIGLFAAMVATGRPVRWKHE